MVSSKLYTDTFFNFISKGKNLKPVAEGCDPGEQWMDIGNVMHVRLTTGRPELVVVRDNESDTAKIMTVKKIIRRATTVRPEDRPTVEWIVEMLSPTRITSSTGVKIFICLKIKI